MLKRTKVSLNKISTDAAVQLIRNALNLGINLKEVYVDTVGPPVTYQALLEKAFPESGIQFTVSAKADSKFPSVSAASIVAKVTRDRTVKNWVYAENHTDEIFDINFGCGYPSDPKTVKWLERSSDPIFGFPDLVRFSWKTTTNNLKDKVKKIKWENYEEEEEDDKNLRRPYINKDNNVNVMNKYFGAQGVGGVGSGVKIEKKNSNKFNFLEKNGILWENLNIFK